MTGTNYYLRQQTRVSGPFTVGQLTSLLQRGRVARSDKISVDKVTWIAIADCPEIAPRAVQAASQSGPATRNEDGIDWFYTVGGTEQRDPVGTGAILQLIAAGIVGGDELVWRQGFVDWRPITAVEQFTHALTAAATPVLPRATDAAVPGAGDPGYDAFVGNKITAGVLALVCGTFGIHKFILGLTRGGTTMLLLSVLLFPIPVLSIVAFVEGVLYLTKPDADFYQDYAVKKKQWF